MGYLSFENLYEIKEDEEQEEEGKKERKVSDEREEGKSDHLFSAIFLDKSKTASTFSLNSK